MYPALGEIPREGFDAEELPRKSLNRTDKGNGSESRVSLRKEGHITEDKIFKLIHSELFGCQWEGMEL